MKRYAKHPWFWFSTAAGISCTFLIFTAASASTGAGATRILLLFISAVISYMWAIVTSLIADNSCSESITPTFYGFLLGIPIGVLLAVLT